MQISVLDDGAMYPLCLRARQKDAPKSEKDSKLRTDRYIKLILNNYLYSGVLLIVILNEQNEVMNLKVHSCTANRRFI